MTKVDPNHRPRPRSRVWFDQRRLDLHSIDVIAVDASRYENDPRHQSTTVLRTVHRGKPERMWTMRGWDTTSWVSDDGDYLVVGYHGVNLVELDHRPDEVICRSSTVERGSGPSV